MLIKSIRWFDGAALNSNEIETFGNKKTVGSREPKQLFSPCALYRASIYTHSWPSSLLGRFQWRRWASPNPLVFLSFFHAGVGGYMGFGSRIPLQLPILLHPFFVTSFVKSSNLVLTSAPGDLGHVFLIVVLGSKLLKFAFVNNCS